MNNFRAPTPYELLSIATIIILIIAIILYPPTLIIIGFTVAGILVVAFVIVTICKIIDKVVPYF